MHYLSTRQVAKLLDISVSLLTKAVWSSRVDPPQKSPSGNFLWTQEDIERAAWILHRYDNYADWQTEKQRDERTGP